MKQHQVRVVAEKEALDSKIDSLQSFIKGLVFIDISTTEQRRLKRQLAIMGLYSDVLEERILAFESEEGGER